MNRIVYTFMFYLAMPLVFLRLLWRSLKSAAYRSRWAERLGFYGRSPLQQRKRVIFHAVSVGEVHAAVPLIRLFQSAYPNTEVVITTTTPTGSARVKAIFSDSVEHVYLPYDIPGAVQRFLDFTRADALIILETELWPNLIHYCSLRKIPVLLVNARLSEKSAATYQKIKRLTQDMLSKLAAIAAQSDADGQRFVELGFDAEKLTISGSMKFDLSIDDAQISKALEYKSRLSSRPIWVAGSTREGEEEKVIEAFQLALKNQPTLLLVIVPRHPERFTSTYKLLINEGLVVAKRSKEDDIQADTQVLLGDTMGEMMFFYALADIAFVGGSLVETGCQNIIEPAALGKPIITGPSLFNFKAVSELMLKAGAMRVVENSAELSSFLLELLNNQEKMALMSSNAKKVVDNNQGATTRLMTLIESYMQ